MESRRESNFEGDKEIKTGATKTDAVRLTGESDGSLLLSLLFLLKSGSGVAQTKQPVRFEQRLL